METFFSSIEWFLGGYDDLLCALLVFVVSNFVTSIMCAIVKKRLSVVFNCKDFFKKAAIFILVGICHIVDLLITHITQVIGIEITIFGIEITMRAFIIIYYIYHESNSLTKNITRLGLPIPKKLKEVLQQLYTYINIEKKKEDQNDEKH